MVALFAVFGAMVYAMIIINDGPVTLNGQSVPLQPSKLMRRDAGAMDSGPSPVAQPEPTSTPEQSR